MFVYYRASYVDLGRVFLDSRDLVDEGRVDDPKVTGRRGVEPNGQIGGGKPIDGTHVVEKVVHLRPGH